MHPQELVYLQAGRSRVPALAVDPDNSASAGGGDPGAPVLPVLHVEGG